MIRTNKPVNLYQLTTELGASIAAARDDAAGTIDLYADVPDETLTAAVDAHVADPSITDPAAVSAEDRVAALEAKVGAAEALAEKANATAQEVAKAMRDAAPGQNR